MKKQRVIAIVTLACAIMVLLAIFTFNNSESTSLNSDKKQYDIVIGNTYNVLDVRELECGYMNPIYRLCIVIKDTNSDNRTYYKYEVNHIDNNYINKAIVAPGDKIKFIDKDTFEIVE